MTARRLFIALFAIALFVMAVRKTVDPDMWWHLRTGEIILEQGIPHQDVFSFTVSDHEWITHEWLSQVIMWLVYRGAGLPGLILFFAFCIGLTYWLVYLCCAGRPFLAAFVVLLAAITSAIVWGARPQIFNLLLTAVFINRVEKFRQADLTNDNYRHARRWLFLLPVLSLVWANLHSGYLLGIVLLATYTTGEALQRWRKPNDSLSWPSIRFLGGITLLCFLAAVVNPNGPELWIYPFFTLGSSAMQAYIQEWHSPNFHLSYFWPFPLMIGLGVVSWLYSRQRPSASELLLFGGTAAAGMISSRNIPIFALVVTPILCRHVWLSLADTAVAPFLQKQTTVRGVLAVLNWGILLVALLAAFVWTANTIIENEAAIADRYPVTAVDFLEESGLAQARGYNSYNWGGYLIWRGLPVFVDGRADVYGDDFLHYYRQTFELKPNWEEPLNEFDVQYIIMERHSQLSILLLASDQWQEAYADELARIFVRRD